MEEQTTSPSGTQRASDASLQRSTPIEDAGSQRDAAGSEIQDPDKKRLHEEAASYRKRAKELETQLKVYQDAEEQAKQAQLSEVERANKQLKAVEQQVAKYKQELINAHVQLAASKQGIIDPEMAALAVQKSLEYDDDGMPSNLDQALADLIKNKPYLAAAKTETPPASPAQTAFAPSVPAMNPDRQGRTSIPSPNKLPPGQRYRLSDLLKTD